MNPGNLRILLSPALTSVLLILCLTVFSALRSHSTGISLHVYQLQPEPIPSGNCNARAIVLWRTRDGRMWINNFEVAPADLTPRLNEIFENRYVRRAYVVADSDLSYGQVADFLSRIANAAPKIYFVLLSGDLRHEAETAPTFEGLCNPFSPESGWNRQSAHYLPGGPKQ